jgi:hypothetical protein
VIGQDRLMVALVRCGRQPDLHVETPSGLARAWACLSGRVGSRSGSGLGLSIVASQAIGGVLDRAAALLPYGPGTSVRHVVGTA